MMSRFFQLGVLFPISLYAFLYFLHFAFFAGPHCSSLARLDGKTVVVTGANKGIGKATAMDLARRGARLILACRSTERGTVAAKEIELETGNKNLVVMQLDLSSFESVRNFVENFDKNEERLDILINNAGMHVSALEHYENGIEKMLMTNHFGHFYLTNLLLNKLKKSGPGARVVTVSSMAYMYANPTAFKNFDELMRDGTKDFDRSNIKKLPLSLQLFSYLLLSRDGLKQYSNSKLANILFSKHLAKILEGTGVTSYVIHPGVIMTDMAKRDLDKHPVFSYVNIFHEYSPLSFFFKTLDEGAQTTICCAVSEPFEAQSGLYYSDSKPYPLYTPEAKDDDLAEKFWNWSQNVVATHT